MESKFYTDVFSRGDKVYLRGYENGQTVERVEYYKPYMFLPKKGGKWSTIDGKDVDKISFDSIKEAKEFIDRYKEVANFDIYGLTNFPYMYIYDNYHGDIQYDTSLISIVSLDIETEHDNTFPDIQKANKAITAITIRKNGHAYSLALHDFDTTNVPNVTYLKCENEEKLLINFLDTWNFKSIKPDIVTGWNIEFFDIPYLYNRIKKVLGESEAKRLSPWKMVTEKNVEFKGKENQSYNIMGIALLDYYQLYRKFSFTNQESYKLDYIAQEVLGEKKLDYSEYGSLQELYENDFQKYMEYNIRDTILVDMLEDKLGFIQLVIAFAYSAKVNFNDTMATVKPWDIIIHNHLLDRRIVVPQFHKQYMPKPLEGGAVKNVKIGLSKWVVSFDLTSLYPHLIMGYNISPETYEGRLEDFPSIEELIKEKHNYSTDQTTADVSVCGNGCMYSKDKPGFLAVLMQEMFNRRVEYKNKMIEAEKELELIERELKTR